MKTLKFFLITSFVLLLFTLLFTQSCSDNSIPVNQTVNNEQQGDRYCQTCWLIVYVHFEGAPLSKAVVTVEYDGESYFIDETDPYGYCSFYTEGIGLPSSPPNWIATANYRNYLLYGGTSFSWNGTSYQYVSIECYGTGR